LGTCATHRLYETGRVQPDETIASYENPDPRWVFLSVEGDDEFTRFCALAGRTDLAGDPRFSSRAARVQNGAALEEVLEDVLRTRSAPEWERAAVAEGVGCVMADGMSHFAFLHRHPQATAMTMMTASEHPAFGGMYWRHAPVVGFSRTPGRTKPFCEKGEHTRQILSELGYDDEAIARLKDDDVITWPADQSETAMAAS
jgi:crotonobetainyl-CoA:carnitine CoA-transferase CaiB-like acyl-CoA transferase